MDLSNEKDRSIFFIVLILIFIAGGNITHHIGVKKTRNWNFKGYVENVSYDSQRNPSVTINGKEYNLYYTIWHFDVKINKGDKPDVRSLPGTLSECL